MAIPIRDPLRNLRSLAEALGFDPDAQKIISIKIDATAQSLEVAVVELIIDIEQHDRLATVLKRFTLVPKETLEP